MTDMPACYSHSIVLLPTPFSDDSVLQACCMHYATSAVLEQSQAPLQLALAWPLYSMCWLTAGPVTNCGSLISRVDTNVA